MKLSLTTKTSVVIAIVAFVLFYIGASIINISLERLGYSQLASKQFQLVELLDSVVLDLNRAEDRGARIIFLPVDLIRWRLTTSVSDASTKVWPACTVCCLTIRATLCCLTSLPNQSASAAAVPKK